MLEGKEYKTQLEIECFGVGSGKKATDKPEFTFDAGTVMEFVEYGEVKQFVAKPTKNMIVPILKHPETQEPMWFLVVGQNLARCLKAYGLTMTSMSIEYRQERFEIERHIDMHEYFRLVDDVSY